VTLAMADPLDSKRAPRSPSCTGLTVEPAIAGEQEILDAIDRYYTQGPKDETELATGTQSWGRTRKI